MHQSQQINEDETYIVSKTTSKSKLSKFKIAHEWTIENLQKHLPFLTIDQSIDSEIIQNDRFKIYFCLNYLKNKNFNVEIHFEALKPSKFPIKFKTMATVAYNQCTRQSNNFTKSYSLLTTYWTQRTLDMQVGQRQIVKDYTLKLDFDIEYWASETTNFVKIEK
ncbi:hypothetical protein TYRP_017825 [Tyrophagus putrescentiae]|nr:hypothetical protein TYRP_017825 [Tyrophagus putrescentiae]